MTPRRIKAWLAFDRAGNVLWGSFRADKEACKAFVEQVSPSVAGFEHMAPVIVPVEIVTTYGQQLDLEDAIRERS